MTPDLFVKSIKAIESLFGSVPYPVNAADDIYADVKDCDDQAMREAYRRIRIEFNTRPTLARVRDICLDEQRKIDVVRTEAIERESAERNKQEWNWTETCQKVGGIAKASALHVARFTSDHEAGCRCDGCRKLRGLKLADIENLHQQFPTAGWHYAASNLREFYEKRSLL